MEVTTKYSLNDKVWLIKLSREEVKIPCATCNGHGFVTINKTPERSCPDCFQRGYDTEWKDVAWNTEPQMTIGKVSYEEWSVAKTGIFDNIGVYDPDLIETEIRYMCYETGVGSGTLYRDKDLYPTKEEAESECLIRNTKKELSQSQRRQGQE